MSTQALLQTRGLSKTFGAVHALNNVDFGVRAGEVMALVGDNGAGKSTLVKTVAGTYPADGGQILFDGEPVTIHGPKDAARLGIEVVYQDLALCDNLDVVQNMFLGREDMASGLVPAALRRPLAPVLEHVPHPLRRMDEETMERRARETLTSLSVTTLRSVRQVVAGLSGGQRQSVAVAKAVLWNSKVVILDEPTAALGVAQTRQVLDLVKRLAEQGLAVILISHNLHDVFEVADRITVLRLGQNVAEFEASQTNQREVVEAITAGKLNAVPGIETEVIN
jgi:D-xylose transport system ATP-binding protein